MNPVNKSSRDSGKIAKKDQVAAGSECSTSGSDSSLTSSSKTTSAQTEKQTHTDSESVIVLGRKKAEYPKESESQGYEIVYFKGEKPNFGGYLDTRNDTVYLHASCQTPIVVPVIDPSIKLECRETQTIEVRSRSQQSSKENSTQMTRIGVYVSTKDDKIITSNQYVTADEYVRRHNQKVIIVQKQVRCFLAKKRINRMKENRQQHLRWLQMQSDSRKQDKEDRLNDAKQRQQYPKSKGDFNMLYNAVKMWRKEKEIELEKSVSGPELKAALYLLGEKESKLLSIIHQHKLVAQEINKVDRFKNSLSRTSAAKKWKFGDGRVAEVFTIPILRCKYLQDLYQTLTLRLSEDERLDSLITLKETVKEFDCELTREIMDLADREADLLVRGLKAKHLAGLRERLLVLFMQFIRTPTFNPAFKKQPEKVTIETIRGKSVCQSKNICQSCGWLYSIKKFVVPGNTSLIRRCQQCAQNENEAVTRNDDSIFAQMLEKLRISEGKLNAKHSVAFIMELKDFRHLIEVIWNNQSVMGADDDLYSLVMCRWHVTKEWSAWNCILLNGEEAVNHFKIKSPLQIYNAALIEKVRKKHLLAKNYFNQIKAATIRFKTM